MVNKGCFHWERSNRTVNIRQINVWYISWIAINLHLLHLPSDILEISNIVYIAVSYLVAVSCKSYLQFHEKIIACCPLSGFHVEASSQVLTGIRDNMEARQGRMVNPKVNSVLHATHVLESEKYWDCP